VNKKVSFKDVSEMMIGVLEQQSHRLFNAINNYSDESFTELWTKEIVARIYSFEHWHSLYNYVRNDPYAINDHRFLNLQLHPNTVSDIDPNLVKDWFLRKEILKGFFRKDALRTQNDSILFVEGDLFDNLMAKMHGFDNFMELWLGMRFHFLFEKENTFISLFHEKNPHLILYLDKTPSKEVMKNISSLFCQQEEVAPVLFIGPKEWIYTSIQNNAVMPVNKYLNEQPFLGWTEDRITQLFSNIIKERYKGFLTMEKAIDLVSASISALIYELGANYVFMDIYDLISVFSLKNLILIANNSTYPSYITQPIDKYLTSLSGYNDKQCQDRNAKQRTQKAHDQIVMLIMPVLIEYYNLFKPLENFVETNFYLLDAHNWQIFEYFLAIHHKKKLINEVNLSMSNLPNKTMIMIVLDDILEFDDSVIEELINSANKKQQIVVFLTTSLLKTDELRQKT